MSDAVPRRSPRDSIATNGGWTYAAALAWACGELRGHVDSPRLDAEVVLAHVLQVSRSRLHAWPEQRLSERDAETLRSAIAQRRAGEPVAYLTGTREFWSLPLRVTPVTLIPRPETELLVERALALVPEDADRALADLGTGCGAIAIALAHERPRCTITATDVSEAALAIARDNANRIAPGRIALRQGDWCSALSGDARYDVIACNPPYVADADPHLRAGDVRFEPPAALRGGADGLDAIRRIGDQARAHLRAGGWLVLEHGYDQGTAVCELLAGLGYIDIETAADLNGHARVTRARFSPQ